MRGFTPMKRIRLDRIAGQLQHAPRNPRSTSIPTQQCSLVHNAQVRSYAIRTVGNTIVGKSRQTNNDGARRRRASTAAATVTAGEELDTAGVLSQSPPPRAPTKQATTASRPRGLRQSAKLAALHARLSLPAKLPLETLARCLIDVSADPRPGHNNAPLATLGQDLLGYYTSEHLICHYPRLPMPILFAAQYAYVGPATLSSIRTEWGVEVAAAPGGEVDPGLLQLKRVTPGNSLAENGQSQVKDMPEANRQLGMRQKSWERRGIAYRIVHDDQFGESFTTYSPERSAPFKSAPLATSTISETSTTDDPTTATSLTLSSLLSSPHLPPADPTTVTAASATFIRALAGALYLHAGADAVKSFHSAHILSRHLALHTLFHFTHPTRDLSFLCRREHFEPPVARLLSETGRLSRTPVFVVGVFSGEEKLGEAAGASLNEARVRAAAAALRSWYLYSPLPEEVMVPSLMEGKGEGEGKRWRAQMIDPGEIIA